jgi:cytidylate kinase
MIVTIDGPAGSGKSSVARGLARRLGFVMLDTGAMYRAVALAVMREGIAENDESALDALLARTRIEMPPGRVLLNGEDVTAVIRSGEMSQAASRLAAIPLIRTYLVAQQRVIGQGRDLVTEGRDQGTVVFPDAARKFFFKADREERARRRHAEATARGEATTLEQILADQDARDRRDAARETGPMAAAADAIVIDTTDVPLEQVIDRLELEVRRCMS